MNTPRVSFVMGWLKLLVSLVWAGLSLAGLVFGARFFAGAEAQLAERIIPVQDQLMTGRALLTETGAALAATEAALVTAEEAALATAATLDDSAALLADVAQVVAEDIPATLVEVQASMPALIETAAAVDQTLGFLAGISLTIPNPFGVDWGIGLGVEYNPEVPLDVALAEVSGGLDGLPEQLQAMGEEVGLARQNAQAVGQQANALAADLQATRQQVAALRDQVEAVSAGLVSLENGLSELYQRAERMLPRVRLAWLGLMSLVLLGQVPGLYLAAVMMRGEWIQTWRDQS